MITNSPLNRIATVALLTAANLPVVGSMASAQQPVTTETHVEAVATAPEETFSFELGRASMDRSPAGSSTYTVAATTAYNSKTKGAKIRLIVVEKEGGGTSTHLLTISTGKYKTVAQLTEIISGIFRKYLAGQAANQEIGKIGDINHGGEIRFFSESRETLRYDWLTPGEPPHSTQFKRADIEVFLGILTHPKTGN